MRDLLEDVALVLVHSPRTRNALTVGFLGGVLIMLAGAYFSSQLAFEGPMAVLTTPFRALLADRAMTEAAIFIMASIGIAAKRFFADRKRLFGY